MLEPLAYLIGFTSCITIGWLISHCEILEDGNIGHDNSD